MTTRGTIVTEYGDTCILGAGHGGHCRIGEGIGRADLVEMLAHAHAAQRTEQCDGWAHEYCACGASRSIAPDGGADAWLTASEWLRDIGLSR